MSLPLALLAAVLAAPAAAALPEPDTVIPAAMIPQDFLPALPDGAEIEAMNCLRGFEGRSMRDLAEGDRLEARSRTTSCALVVGKNPAVAFGLAFYAEVTLSVPAADALPPRTYRLISPPAGTLYPPITVHGVFAYGPDREVRVHYEELSTGTMSGKVEDVTAADARATRSTAIVYAQKKLNIPESVAKVRDEIAKRLAILQASFDATRYRKI